MLYSYNKILLEPSTWSEECQTYFPLLHSSLDMQNADKNESSKQFTRCLKNVVRVKRLLPLNENPIIGRDFADYHSCEAMPERCSNHKECGPQEECIETLARGFNARSPEWSSRCMQIPFRRCIQVSTGWGVHLFRRFCKMFSESSPGYWAVLKLPCCPIKEGELSENI